MSMVRAIRNYWPALASFICIAIFIISWNVSIAPKKLSFSLEDVRIKQWKVELGEDRTGVPTALLSCQIDFMISYINPNSIWGLDVDGEVSMRIFLRPITAAKIRKFEHPGRSQGSISMKLVAVRTPLYGASPAVVSVKDATKAGGGGGGRGRGRGRGGGGGFYVVFEASIKSTNTYLSPLFRFGQTHQLFCQYTGASVSSNYTLAVTERGPSCPQLIQDESSP